MQIEVSDLQKTSSVQHPARGLGDRPTAGSVLAGHSEHGHQTRLANIQIAPNSPKEEPRARPGLGEPKGVAT